MNWITPRKQIRRIFRAIFWLTRLHGSSVVRIWTGVFAADWKNKLISPPDLIECRFVPESEGAQVVGSRERVRLVSANCNSSPAGVCAAHHAISLSLSRWSAPVLAKNNSILSCINIKRRASRMCVYCDVDTITRRQQSQKCWWIYNRAADHVDWMIWCWPSVASHNSCFCEKAIWSVRRTKGFAFCQLSFGMACAKWIEKC